MSSESRAFWYSLDTKSSPKVDQVGGKGLSLIQCSSAAGHSFRVPPGFVLTTDFFEPWLQQIQKTSEYKRVFLLPSSSSNDRHHAGPPSREECDAVKSKCRGLLTLSKTQRMALEEAIKSFQKACPGDCLVAVRSSAPQEDSKLASLAGIYHTTLGVRIEQDHLVPALVDSFASVLDYRVAAVSDHVDHRIAVVVQLQLDSQASGVAFSLDPQSNCYDEAVICANHGLGETVVAGIVTPDTYKVDKIKKTIIDKQISDKTVAYVLDKTSGSGVMERPNEDPSNPTLSDEQIVEVATLVTEVEAFMGVPVDTEWAYHEDGKLYLLQARPITTYVKLFPEMVTPPGKRKSLYMDVMVCTQGFSEPLSVLGLEVWGRLFRKVRPQMKTGLDGTIIELHGRQFIPLSNLLAVFGGESMVKKVMTIQGDHMARIMESIDVAEYKPEKPTEKNKGYFWGAIQHIFQMLPFMMKGLWNAERSMDSYLAKWNEIYELYGNGGPEDARTNLGFGEAVDQVMDKFEELVPLIGSLLTVFYSKWRLHRLFSGDKEAEEMLVTLHMDLKGNPTSEMGHAMLRLASFPEMREIESSETFLKKLEEKSLSKEFVCAWDDYLAKFGCRGMREIDIATPRSYEDIAHLFDRIKQIDVENNHILTVVQRKEEAYKALMEKAKKRGIVSSFEHHSNIVKNIAGYREHGKFVYVFMVAYLRRRALKLAEKFVAEGRLDEANQVFDLTIDEISIAEVDPYFDLSECVKRNKAPYEEVAHTKVWPEVIDSRGKILRAPRKDVEDGIGGDPISPGKVTGRARVLFSPYEKPLVQGEILVARATEPSWTPIFLNASAVVLEVGGPLQHGAIIAREYGIPCVSGLIDATSIIHDGLMIEVDGTNGIVRILDQEEGHEKKAA